MNKPHFTSNHEAAALTFTLTELQEQAAGYTVLAFNATSLAKDRCPTCNSAMANQAIHAAGVNDHVTAHKLHDCLARLHEVAAIYNGDDTEAAANNEKAQHRHEVAKNAHFTCLSVI
jgi:hypothetical protein